MYLRRRMLAVCVVVLLGVVALFLAALAQVPEGRENSLPIDPNTVGPDAVLAEAAGVPVSTPVRPEAITGLGYHPEGKNLLALSPRGRNLSMNAVLALFGDGSTPEGIQYHLMDSASRPGPPTSALDVGAEAGTAVYAPISGTITAIRPDPVLQEGASIVEIKPAEEPDVRVLVSLVEGIDGGVGPRSPVTAGITRLGSVANTGQVLKPQLASYTSDAGNHVTISATKTG